mmetsp:Transcript_12733/g.22514  ORF Transcript_12733/g.22514 Transcript_12733/m.22514 type:complete len:353 (-) Transcript_12733:110-1168(-)|eukprot:CAMPEP_0119107338 /NCGR_PEP_ID=MMETSP1180-20130426/9648_1 /TAXON_ID=3052 ORGANISM="Chlamydomonas cf sp, Strain CCMP681" /NCGR_SAMPLE_ID=MMETSP1180 /ASSEMBLY_ACC=CAM_ASM_000741 /LENGTH=352 /DNA_ID=CAMNT_0007092811 /DNA_START=49 /DNA_END=1107 /DNA_ORIENTATION=-
MQRAVKSQISGVSAGTLCSVRAHSPAQTRSKAQTARLPAMAQGLSVLGGSQQVEQHGVHQQMQASHAQGLSPQQVEDFNAQGFLVLEGHAPLEQCTALKARVDELLQGFDPSTVKSVFSTKNQTETTDAYFLNSASNVSFFLEEKAIDEAGNLLRPKEKAINKIGHALHDVDPVFREFSRSPAVTAIMHSLGYKRPLPVQSMYIFKQPSIGGEVSPHQDSCFIITEPLTCVGLWWALEDCTKENGCLWAMPGIHKKGLNRRFERKDGKMVFDRSQPDYDLSQFQPIECPAGTLVLLQGENVHYSCENTSPVSRHSYSMHLVESAPGVTWVPENWAHRPAGTPPWTPLYDSTD